MSLPIPMMNDDGLLECAHCSSQETYTAERPGYPVEFYVECGKCECKTADYLVDKHAIRSWNTRAGHLFTEQDYKDMSEERKNDWS